jgi:hypothetical protein
MLVVKSPEKLVQGIPLPKMAKGIKGMLVIKSPEKPAQNIPLL